MLSVDVLPLLLSFINGSVLVFFLPLFGPVSNVSFIAHDPVDPHLYFLQRLSHCACCTSHWMSLEEFTDLKNTREKEDFSNIHYHFETKESLEINPNEKKNESLRVKIPIINIIIFQLLSRDTCVKYIRK